MAHLGYMWGLHKDNGKEHGNDYLGLKASGFRDC